MTELFVRKLSQWKTHLLTADCQVQVDAYMRHVHDVKRDPLFATWEQRRSALREQLEQTEAELASLRAQQAEASIPGVSAMAYSQAIRDKQPVDDMVRAVRRHVAPAAQAEAEAMMAPRAPPPPPASFQSKLHKSAYLEKHAVYEADLKRTVERLTTEKTNRILQTMRSFGEKVKNLNELEYAHASAQRELRELDAIEQPYRIWVRKHGDAMHRLYAYQIWTTGFNDAWYPDEQTFLADRQRFRAIVRAEALANRDNAGMDIDAYIDSL